MKKIVLICLAAFALLLLGIFFMIPISHEYVSQPDARNGKDAVYSLLVPNNNYGTLTNIHLYAWTQQGELNVNRVSLAFDFSSIPPDAKLQSAHLSLFFDPDSNYRRYQLQYPYQENTFLIQRLTSDWDEKKVTWINQPSTDPNVTVRVPMAPLGQDYKNLDVLPLVQRMFAEPLSSYGFYLRHEVEEPYKLTILASSNHPIPERRPKLEIRYTATLWQSLAACLYDRRI